jgi:hypothetical protein
MVWARGRSAAAEEAAPRAAPPDTASPRRRDFVRELAAQVRARSAQPGKPTGEAPARP